jgi:hypothetical protein
LGVAVYSTLLNARIQVEVDTTGEEGVNNGARVLRNKYEPRYIIGGLDDSTKGILSV